MMSQGMGCHLCDYQSCWLKRPMCNKSPSPVCQDDSALYPMLMWLTMNEIMLEHFS